MARCAGSKFSDNLVSLGVLYDGWFSIMSGGNGPRRDGGAVERGQGGVSGGSTPDRGAPGSAIAGTNPFVNGHKMGDSYRVRRVFEDAPHSISPPAASSRTRCTLLDSIDLLRPGRATKNGRRSWRNRRVSCSFDKSPSSSGVPFRLEYFSACEDLVIEIMSLAQGHGANGIAPNLAPGKGSPGPATQGEMMGLSCALSLRKPGTRPTSAPSRMVAR